MQWKQIKVLFILCFLVLDVYLLVMFFQKQEEADFGVLETQTSTFDEELEDENITISADLPEKQLEKSFISVKQKSFTKKEEKSLNDKDNLETSIIDNTLMLGKFEEPIPLPKNAQSDVIVEQLKPFILSPESYIFWDWNKEMNVLVFFQQKKNSPVYFNQSGIVLVFLNDENEMIFFTQTMLGKAKSPGEGNSLIKPMQAIRVLYQNNQLGSGDDITDVNMGFYTRIPLEGGEQVFAPTWMISVNEEENFYVNAIENRVFSSNELHFLKTTAISILTNVGSTEEENKIKGFVINHLNDKLRELKRSETE